MSALPSKADIICQTGHVRKVPRAEVSDHHLEAQHFTASTKNARLSRSTTAHRWVISRRTRQERLP
jgi:hypothetical protein